MNICNYCSPLKYSVGHGTNEVFYLFDHVTLEGKNNPYHKNHSIDIIVTGMESERYLRKKIDIEIEKSKRGKLL